MAAATNDVVVANDDDEDDELEPLFSYKRVCRPPSYDDSDNSDDDVKVICGKTGKYAAKSSNCNNLSSQITAADVSGRKIHEDNLVHAVIDDDEDWLPSPPKNAIDESKIYSDPTFREIRQNREELIKLAASSEAVLKILEQENNCSKDISTMDACSIKQESCATGKREKVQVSIQNKDGACKAFRIYKDDKFEKLFLAYAESISVQFDQLVFVFDGQKVSSSSTPSDLEIEDEDILEVYLRIT